MNNSLRFFAVVLVLSSMTLAAWPQAGSQRETPGSARVHGGVRPSASSISATAREEAYRANNMGVALLEQFSYREGAEAFRRALVIDPQLAIARINLAIALYNVPETEAALREARVAAELAPRAPQPHYILGLIARAQNRTPDAIAAFRRVLEIDAQDVGANIQLGQLYAQQRQYTEAVAAFRIALAAEPYNATAVYNLATALSRTEGRGESAQLLRRFQELRQSGAGTIIGQNYLEQGRYAEAITSTGAEPGLADRRTPSVTFTDATASMMPPTNSSNAGEVQPQGISVFLNISAAGLTDNGRRLVASLGGGTTLFDHDLDGDLDLLDVQPFALRLYRNDAGRFVDTTESSGALAAQPANRVGIGAVTGDYNNDGRPDIFVLRYGGGALYRNEGNGRFTDATAIAGIPNYQYLSISSAFADVDHDGDLDLFIAGLVDLARAPGGRESYTLENFPAAPNLLLRNNGDGTFADITTEARVSGSPAGRTVAVIPTDYDNRRDVDLMLVNFGAPPVLYRNLRDRTFRDVAAEVGLTAPDDPVNLRFTCAAAGDFNKDGFTDFFFGHLFLGGTFAISDGRGRFTLAGDQSRWIMRGLAPFNHAAQFLDYDNDGLLDALKISSDGVRVWRNVGDGWANATTQAESEMNRGAGLLWDTSLSRPLASGDLDGDGDTDLVLRSASGALVIGRNEGGNHNRSIRVQLAGRVSNRSGVGAKIETRAGSLRQKLETYSASPAPAPADVVFGLGNRETPDAIRVLWPAGIVQAETQIAQSTPGQGRPTSPGSSPNARSLTITELDRRPSSCPYLFAWNGERFEFITDFMGGGEMGYTVAPGTRNQPDPDEYVRIRADQLRERDGRFEIRVTNELEEALFVDRLQLLAISHPEGVEVYPNEGLGNPTSSTFQLYATRDARAPLSATDDHGHDMLTRLARVDRQYVDDFQVHPIRGYAEPHTLTLNLGSQAEASNRTLLLMTGWTDYAFSSDNIAAAQRELQLQPPALQVRNARGEWQTVIGNVGVPVGRPQTVTVDLTGKFLTANREVRIVTNMRIYWDQILVDTWGGDFPVEIRRLEPSIADLHWRGFSREATPDGRAPEGYDYARVSFDSPWKTMTGRYTREGDVRELLLGTDDMFVVSRSGDEIAVGFDAGTLPALPRGWTRTFLLYVDGYSKEMDINSSSPDSVSPLPFHGMSSYPYGAPEAYPMTEERRAYIERYNTRIVTARMPSIEASILIAQQERNIGSAEASRSSER